MRKFFVLAAALLSLVSGIAILNSTTASAQGFGAGQGQARRGGQMTRLISALNLTPDQVAKIKPILEASRSQVESIRNDSTLTDDQKMAKVKAIRESDAKQIMPLLTADQITKWKAMRTEARQKWGGAGQAGGGQAAGG